MKYNHPTIKDVSITYKSVLKGLSVKERNKVFNSLSDEGKRLEIAWEGLQLVLTGIAEGSDGCYWGFELHQIVGQTKTASKFQQKLLNPGVTCRVCQRGLLMLSQIRIGNCISPASMNYDNGDEDTVKGFAMTDFKAMENEYESSEYYHPYRYNTDEKLANICCNVLVNGNFNVNDKTNYLILHNSR